MATQEVCDQCEKVRAPGEMWLYLEVSMGRQEKFDFCSWQCVGKHARAKSAKS